MLQLRPTHADRRLSHHLSWLLALCSFTLILSVGSAAFGATFDPTQVMSDDNMRAYDSWSQADIQAFLNKQKGPLKSLVTTDYAGKSKPAAQIIAEACRQWKISPKVMLTMLQKEQSLLTRTTLVTGQLATLDWAVCYGCPDSYSTCYGSGCHSKQPSMKRYPEYAGFGRQIWAAAWNLDAYGEKGKTRPKWHHSSSPTTTWGTNWKLGDTAGPVVPKNLATFKLYTYNPSIGATKPYGDLSKQSTNLSGNASFWWLYTKNFGDTFANPAKRTVYRFRDVKNGSYFWTARESERYAAAKDKRYKYELVAWTWNTSETVCPSAMYRFYNRKTKAYLFTSSRAQRDALRSKAKARVWRFDGWGFKVSYKSTTSRPVYWFSNKKTGLPFFSTSTADKSKFSSAKYRRNWRYRGIAFYVPK